MTELYNIEFYGIHESQSPLGFVAVDEGVALTDVRQVMANWYFNHSEQYAQFIYEVQLGREDRDPDEPVEVKDDNDEDVHAPFVGAFIVRDSHGRVIERVASEIVRHSPEMSTADPLWFERRDPDYERKKAEAEELRKQAQMRWVESAAYASAYGVEHDDDPPF